ANPPLRDFLIALRQTGTRPATVAGLRPENFDEANRCWVFRKHKTAHATGELLVVHLTDVAINLTRKKLRDWETRKLRGSEVDYLFVNGRGNPWTDSAWGKAFAGLRKTLKKRHGIDTPAVAYWFRHTFVTSHLAAGVSDNYVASLVGHKSTAMLHKHYAHLTSRAKLVKAHLNVKPLPEEEAAIGADVASQPA